ncbi:non-canonical poly(A) RNA polymerase protein Trf4-1-like isoform X1 [Drosophila albomicans]|uniref:Non-canonical poly(A) RNA polymerase protein Trf4-1-like isoform X1 n=1 Tax=Drosophila albomicans TaxID=7291 RepID=A0A6P8W7E6_DROAB|nr:non-canonical poly(A) RNA polymerase protein Trf4-1-like isoform X1 [Drosophila albomicans]
MVVKQFLQQRGLNEVFSGGISSYSLTIMCVSFLQLHPRKVVASKANLGVLLLEFFELYGSRFSYTNIQISVENGGSYRRAPLTSISQIFLPDPLNLENNIGRATNRIMAIRQAFRWAFQVLTLSINSTQRNNNSILGQIIHFNKEVVDQRAWLQKTFGHLIVVKPNEDESTSSQPVEPNS